MHSASATGDRPNAAPFDTLLACPSRIPSPGLTSLNGFALGCSGHLCFAKKRTSLLWSYKISRSASVLVPQIAGTPTQIADQLDAMVAVGGADGFMILPATLPGSLERFVQRVVPELQHRGRVPRDFSWCNITRALLAARSRQQLQAGRK